MLENDPPSGTRLVVMRDVTRGFRVLKAYATATMIGSVRKYSIERPEDEFDILYFGERIRVQRQDIKKA